MEQIACIVGNVYIYWSSVIRILAAAAGVFAFFSLYLRRGAKPHTAVGYILLAVALSLVLARMFHWYFLPDAYETPEAAWNLLLPGGFALIGVFAGCFLAAVLLRVTRATQNLPELLDCVCLAGGLGIGVGRLASWFNASDRGMIMPETLGFPWADMVINPVSGVTEYRLATFLLQAIVAGWLFLILLIRYLAGEKNQNRRDGDAALLFLLCYGAAQVLLDSTRYDSLSFRSNGFVSVVQVLSAAAMALVVILFAARLVSTCGWNRKYLLVWIVQAGCFGLAGYMEYYVQRYGGRAVFAYCVMGTALVGIVILTLVTRQLTMVEEKKQLRKIFPVSGEGVRRQSNGDNEGKRQEI